MAELSSSVSAWIPLFCEFYGSRSYHLTLAGLDAHLPLLSHATNQLFAILCVSSVSVSAVSYKEMTGYGGPNL